MTSRHALALCACTVLVLVFIACGDDGEAGAAVSSTEEPEASGRDTQTEPTLQEPASTYALTAHDLEEMTSGGNAFVADPQQTYVLDAENYGKVVSDEGGNKLLAAWGYIGGYETAFVPEGQDAAVLDGAYYAVLEVHLFETPEGAAKAFRHFRNKLRDTPAKWMRMPQVGNESSAWSMTYGKLSNSEKARVHSTVLFRRGNMVAVILAIGAEDHIDAETMRKLAAIVDDKALEQQVRAEPSPTATEGAR